MTNSELAHTSSLTRNALFSDPGNAPMVPIKLMIDTHPQQIHLKLEGVNPTGSVKDRTGYSLMLDLEERELLKSGTIVVESTSGNLGVSLAFLCQMKGVGFLAVVDPKVTQENLDKMRSFGAQILVVDQLDKSGGYLLSRLQKVKELLASSPLYVWPDQYTNPANPYIHYMSTGPEIYEKMQGRVDAIFIPVSTGGTLAGVSRFFREKSPSTCIIGVDAYGSVVFGTPPGPRKLTGIGSSCVSHFITSDLYDEYMLVEDQEAFDVCRALDTTLNISVGGSSGAAVAACKRYLAIHPEAERVVCLCADRGSNYATSIFNDDWLASQGFTLPERPATIIHS